VLTVGLLVVLLAFAGFAIDVGHAFLVQRQLQAGVDAAALAGAQELPDAAIATQTALDYGPTPALAGNPSKPNDVTTVDNAVTNVTIKCLRSYGCVGRRAKKNGIEVTASSNVPTWFAKVLGRNSFTVHANSTACSPCAAKGFDVMVVFDRTGSMCTGGCADLNNAKNGVRQFLKAMDPGLDKVGLAVFPPVLQATSNCAIPYQGTQGGRNGRRYGYDAWWPDWDRRNRNGTPNLADTSKYAIVSPDFDYLAESPAGSGNWVLTNNGLNSTLNCLQAAGNTSYANAIVEAKHELVLRGNGNTPDGMSRGNAPDVIVFVTDGAANTMPQHSVLPTNPVADGLPSLDLEPYGTNTGNPVNRPCRAGVVAADWAKQQGTLIYVIGFGLAGGGNGEECNEPGGTALNPETTLRAIATDPTTYYGTPEGGDLGLVFEQIASDIRDRQGRLVPDGSN
jgi:Putative Flp pilus-assembly TadE/G-like